MLRNVSRRRFLSLTTTGTAVALAGCGGSQEPEKNSPTNTASTLPPTPTPRRLTWGDTVQTPQGLELAVRGGNFTSSYSRSGGNQTVTPPEGDQFLLIQVAIRNPTSDSITFPSIGYFSVRTDESTYRVLTDNPSRQLEINPQNQTRIELPFVVPKTLTSSDIAVWWTPAYENERIAVVWSSN